MMKNIFKITILLSLLILSCKTKEKTSNEKNYAAEGYVSATIKKYDVDGCGFMLFLADDKKLNPSNLEEKFKKEGLKVWVKYAIQKNTVSICMAGPNVTVTEIIPANQ